MTSSAGQLLLWVTVLALRCCALALCMRMNPLRHLLQQYGYKYSPKWGKDTSYDDGHKTSGYDHVVDQSYTSSSLFLGRKPVRRVPTF